MTAGSGVAGGQGVLSDPLSQFFVQVAIIVTLCKALALPLKRWLKQPSVIAEIIAGIILGPSVMMRIPGFRETIFSPGSLSFLNLFANLGLVLFLFIIGMEVEFESVKKSWKTSAVIAGATMVVPFGLGCAIASPIHSFFSPGVAFGPFLLFVGTILSITAFPVLARILLESNMLQTELGQTTLYAAAMGDVTAWTLLALCVALARAGSPLVVLWILLLSAGYGILMAFPVRLLLAWLTRGKDQEQLRSNPLLVPGILIGCLVSSWVTNFIGIHSIFGAFVMGLVTPRNITNYIMHSIEQIVVILFLPVYFAYSGLQTSLGLLNSGTVWAYTVLVVVVAFISKIIPGTIAARLCGLPWLDAMTLGIFMNTRGLVGLIVLNIGLEAEVLTEEVFTVLILMTLVTTFATAPWVAGMQVLIKRRNQRAKLPRQFLDDFRIMMCIRSEDQAQGLVLLAEALSHNKRVAPGLENDRTLPSPAAFADPAASARRPSMDGKAAVSSTAGSEAPILASKRRQDCRLYALSMRQVSNQMSHYIHFDIEMDPLVRALRGRAKPFQLGVRPISLPVVDVDQVVGLIRDAADDKRIDCCVLSVPAVMFDPMPETRVRRNSSINLHSSAGIEIPRIRLVHDCITELRTNVVVLVDRQMEFQMRITRVLVVLTGSEHDEFLVGLVRRLANSSFVHVVFAPTILRGPDTAKSASSYGEATDEQGSVPLMELSSSSTGQSTTLDQYPVLKEAMEKHAGFVEVQNVALPGLSFSDAVVRCAAKLEPTLAFISFVPPEDDQRVFHPEIEAVVTQATEMSVVVVKSGSHSVTAEAGARGKLPQTEAEVELPRV